jgi:hypothetical protein
MRHLWNRDFSPRVTYFNTVDGQPLVRLRLGSLWYGMTPAEATQLATDLVDTVDELLASQRRTARAAVEALKAEKGCES